MKVNSIKQLKRVRITYDNSTGSNDRDNVFNYLDDIYGVLGYTITRQGPKPNCRNIGLIIAEIEVKEL